MDLSRDLWYVRWFFWSVGIVSICSNWKNDLRMKRDVTFYEIYGTTLCQFLRVVLIWAPFVIALHVIVYGGALVACIFLPGYLFGTGYVVTILGGGAFVLLCWGVKRLWRTAVVPAIDKIDVAIGHYQANRQARGPSFPGIVWEQVKAAKRGVCPLIRFN